MKYFVPIALAALLLAGCGSSSSIASNVAAPPDNVVGDAGGVGLARASNAGAREQALRAAAPVPTDGMEWHWDNDDHGATFGPSDTISTFAIACHNGRIVVRRFDAAPQGGHATMSFTGNGKAASLPAAAAGDTTRLSSWWEASLPMSDTTQAVKRVFDGPGPVEVSLAGTTTLIARPSPLPVRALTHCPA